MSKKAMAFCCLIISEAVQAGFNVSIEKDLIELSVSAAITEQSYLYIGTDSNEWLGVGVGYQHRLSSKWTTNAYYEFGLENDWLMNDMLEVDGVKTKSHFLDFSTTRRFDDYSIKMGITGEFTRNGFTWITVDDSDKYSIYASAAHYFQHIYLTGRYEHHYAIDRSDMIDFNQGHANEWEFSIGTMRSIWTIYPYLKATILSPNGTYYGSQNTSVNWTVGGSISF
ncbi:hypothetical protein LZU85_11525 [Vibrio sp. IRLE0018]|uniref:hypothetical protein n=1 Tax=Vibrio floridensis TaxID=2908007 RepID=UPI001F298428|nr:hypothetical protein [Vibrio floridensis]MCF8779428.1 hypothetical protein [Vibrio floridensis]